MVTSGPSCHFSELPRLMDPLLAVEEHILLVRAVLPSVNVGAGKRPCIPLLPLYLDHHIRLASDCTNILDLPVEVQISGSSLVQEVGCAETDWSNRAPPQVPPPQVAASTHP